MNQENATKIIVVALLLALFSVGHGRIRAAEIGSSRIGLPADKVKGVVTVKSNNSFSETVAKLVAAIDANPALKIVAKIDHSANAKGTGLELRPTVLFIFGNPQMGTPLIAAAQTAALDLPQKMIVFEDEKGVVFVAYNNQALIAKRHGIAVDHAAVKTAETGLANLAKAATTK